MGRFADMPSFRRLLSWIDGNGGSGYGCIELSTARDVREFLTELRQSLGEEVVEVCFSPDPGGGAFTDSDLVVPGRLYETIRNFASRYPEKPILAMTGLHETVPREDESLRKLADRINMNRESFYRYPSIILFFFPNWFMDILFRQAYDFVSAMGFHEDLTGEEELATVVSSPSACEGTPVLLSHLLPLAMPFLFDSYAGRMRDTHLSAAERLEAAAKLLAVIRRRKGRTDSDRKLVGGARKLLALETTGREEAELWRSVLLAELKEWGYLNEKSAPFDEEGTEGFLPIE